MVCIAGQGFCHGDTDSGFDIFAVGNVHLRVDGMEKAVYIFLLHILMFLTAKLRKIQAMVKTNCMISADESSFLEWDNNNREARQVLAVWRKNITFV